MFLHKANKGQSVLEYTLLIGVIVAGVIIMQTFLKRHVQGGLKESGEKLGETFSASGTTTSHNRTMTTNQIILEEQGTIPGAGLAGFGVNVTGTVDKGAYQYTSRTGGASTLEQKTATDAAAQENFQWGNYSTSAVTNFTPPF